MAPYRSIWNLNWKNGANWNQKRKIWNQATMHLALQKTSTFQNAAVPAGTTLAGMAALVEAFRVQ
jgi:hypothetical protein